jgi:hypothetical protein
MNASTLVAFGDDHQDATFVHVSCIFKKSLLSQLIVPAHQYEMLVDRNAQYPKRPVMLELQIFFGQLQHIFVIRLEAYPVVGLTEDTTLILAAIRACADAKLKAENNIYYYS